MSDESYPKHEQVTIRRIRCGGPDDGRWETVEVDVGIAKLLEALWLKGIDTFSSCQGEPGQEEAYICFPRAEDALRLMQLIAAREEDADIRISMIGGSKSTRPGVKFRENGDTNLEYESAPGETLVWDEWRWSLNGDPNEKWRTIRAIVIFPSEGIDDLLRICNGRLE